VESVIIAQFETLSRRLPGQTERNTQIVRQY